MKNCKVYAEAMIYEKDGKKWGGVRFTFNPNEIRGKKYVVEEEDYNSKFLSEILNDVFVYDFENYQIYCKNIMNKLNLNKKIKEVNKDVSNNSNTL